MSTETLDHDVDCHLRWPPRDELSEAAISRLVYAARNRIHNLDVVLDEQRRECDKIIEHRGRSSEKFRLHLGALTDLEVERGAAEAELSLLRTLRFRSSSSAAVSGFLTAAQAVGGRFRDSIARLNAVNDRHEEAIFAGIAFETGLPVESAAASSIAREFRIRHATAVTGQAAVRAVQAAARVPAASRSRSRET